MASFILDEGRLSITYKKFLLCFNFVVLGYSWGLLCVNPVAILAIPTGNIYVGCDFHGERKIKSFEMIYQKENNLELPNTERKVVKC